MSRNKLRTHWATTWCGPFKVRIFKNADTKFTDKYHGSSLAPKDVNGAFEVDINADLFSVPGTFNETLLHELVHVLEHIHRKDKTMFSIKLVGDCTALAKTIGAGLGEMLTRLTQIAPKKIKKRRA